ncbi:uncharacterized protein LOC125062172 isoform X1 [Pieris napi]|uniref:uncharacterized protein LOC125062172 isoform X1 n=1 Tax=Pieris napi TaxID=78633 RepID=UPI001FBB520B|nr:uncharacterized protein LOC125062172 isoform X1 [Pieris napi]
MFSSDSEDDYYGNTTKRLQYLKNKYSEDKIDSANLLKDSVQPDSEACCSTAVNTSNTSSSKPNVETKISLLDDSLLENESFEDRIIQSMRQSRAQKMKETLTNFLSRSLTFKKKGKEAKGGRGSKSQSKLSKHNSSTEFSPNTLNVASKRRSIAQRVQGSCRGRGSKSQSKLSKHTQDSDTEFSHNNLYVAPMRRSIAQRVQGSCSRNTRQTRKRGTRNVENIQIQSETTTSQTVYPTYSVGNTAEYQDLSENVHLFNTKPLTQEVYDPLDENEELSVKVYWRSSEVVRFTIRKFQKILQIFEFFAEKENVTRDRLLFLYNDRILKPHYTPDKINYKITKFIEGGLIPSAPILDDSIISHGFSHEELGNGLKLKFQCQNIKKPLVLYVQKEEKLLQAMVKCAEHFEKPLNALKFVFDGDAISGSMTPDELDLEGDECIDVKFVS